MWQEAQAGGIMHFMPLATTDINATQQSLSRLSFREDESPGLSATIHDHDEPHSILHSVEELFERLNDAESEIKAESDEGNQILRSDSTSTLPTCSGDGVLTPYTSSLSMLFDTPLTTNSIPNDDLYEQLRICASSLSGTRSEHISSTPIPSEEYDSDGTDFLLSPNTPCPRRGALNSPRQTGRTSHFFQKTYKTKKSKTVRRTLDFRGPTTVRVGKRGPKPNANTKKAPLPEYSTRHSWKDAEKEFLCVLWRWYSRAPRKFTEIFNSAFGLDNLPLRKVQNYYENNIRLFANAVPEYRDVMAVPFHDPEGTYDRLRAIIETTARDLGIEIHKLHEEVFYPSGQAAMARAPLTRRRYRNLVRKASQKKKSASTHIPGIKLSIQSLGGMALNTTPWEELEVLLDSEPNNASCHSDRPNLVFRCWDESSMTPFIEGQGFVAGAFVNWPRPFPKPIPPTDQYEAFTILAQLHLSKVGDTPVFIATACSLLQVLCKASTLGPNTRISVIDLNSSSLQEEHKVSHAAEVFKDLKKRGIKLPNRYKGYGDWFCWSEVPAQAVLTTMYLTDLQDLCDRDPCCARLLNLSAFNGSPTNQVASQMRDRNLVLNTQTARSLGTVSRSFAMNGPKVRLSHIVEFVARFVDGFYIQEPSAVGIHTMSSLAHVFAEALGTHPEYNHQQIMGAFMEGIEEGIKCAQRWSRSSSGSKHAKRRQYHLVR